MSRIIWTLIGISIGILIYLYIGEKAVMWFCGGYLFGAFRQQYYNSFEK
jgi:hypothetical protein